METHDKESRTVKATAKTFDIIETIKERDGATVTSIADALNMPKTTVYDHLYTLLEKEYLVKEGDVYHLSLKFCDLGTYTKNRQEIIKPARPTLQQLAEDTSELVWLSVEERGKVVLLCKAEGPRSIRTTDRIGKAFPMHASSAGKAILAHFPEKRRSEIIETHGLVKLTENTITDRDELLSELTEIRESGYAFSDEEAVSGIRSIAAPIIVDEEVIAGVGISGPKHRLKGEYLNEILPDDLLGTTNEIELKLQY